MDQRNGEVPTTGMEYALSRVAQIVTDLEALNIAAVGLYDRLREATDAMTRLVETLHHE